MSPCDVTCPKCGSNQTQIKYYGEGWYVGDHSDYANHSEYVEDSTYHHVALKECLAYTCKTCEYQWFGNCIEGQDGDE